MNNPSVAAFTKEEIIQTREAVLKALREKSAMPTKPTEKKPAPIFFDVKTSVVKQKTNFKIVKAKTPTAKNIRQPAIHQLIGNFPISDKSYKKINTINPSRRGSVATNRLCSLVKHLEKNDSPLHQHYFLRSLKLLIFILTLAIIFLSGLLYVVFYFGAEGGS